MKEDEKQRKFHEALLKMLYPPPPSPPPDHREDENIDRELIDSLNGLPEEELKNEEAGSPLSSSDGEKAENGGPGKLKRAQRKRLRKKKLKEDASQRRKIIGPLLPGSSDDRDDDNVEVVEDMPRQNASPDAPGSNCLGEPPSCSKQNKLKQRRKLKKLAGKKSSASSIKAGASHPKIQK